MKVKLAAHHPHPEDLESGRILAPGEETEVRKEEVEGDDVAKAQALIEAGDLFVIQERQSRKKED